MPLGSASITSRYSGKVSQFQSAPWAFPLRAARATGHRTTGRSPADNRADFIEPGRDFEGRGEGEGVHYLIKRAEDFRGKKVVIAGGGDSAVDWALSLAGVAGQLTVVHRRDKFRSAPESAGKLKKLASDGAVELAIPFQLAALEGEAGRLSAVLIRDLDGGERRIEADALLPFYGLAQDLGPIAEWGLNLERNLIGVDPATCLTNRPGIFAVGDIAEYPGKLKLILTGFSEAAMAAHAAYALVHPDQELHFEYSTIKGLPGGGS